MNPETDAHLIGNNLILNLFRVMNWIEAHADLIKFCEYNIARFNRDDPNDTLVREVMTSVKKYVETSDAPT